MDTAGTTSDGDRLRALRAAMEETGVDLAVVGPSSNLRYLLGFRSLAVDRITVLLVTGDSAIMLLPDFDVDEFVETTGFESCIGWRDKSGPQGSIREAFQRLEPPMRDPVVVIDDDLPFVFLALLADHLGDRRPRTLSDLLAPLRAVKAEDEQQQISSAGEIVSLGIDFALEAARPGASEAQLAAEIEAALRDEGAETADFVLVAAGEGSAAPHHQAGARQLRREEPVLFDLAVRFQGYFADITQQVFLGEPPEEYRNAYEVVRRAQDLAVQATVPGATAHDIDLVARKVIVDAGLGELCGPRTGHGVGLDVHEPPSLVEGNVEPLRAGNVVTVEPGVYIRGRFGIRIEDTVLVTNDGPVRLTRGARPMQVRQ
jgi:Xaa-Pro aminopeptidase